jgi:hypothetical protein
LQQELSAKEARLSALLAEHASVSRAFALKESLLQERSDILREELLAQRAAESQENALVGQVVPRLQHQVQELESKAKESAVLAEQLAAELRQRDQALESTLSKYEQLSEQFIQLKLVTAALNERLLSQGAALERSKHDSASRASEGRDKALEEASQTRERLAALQQALDYAKTQAVQESAASDARVKEMESRANQAAEALAKAEAELASRLEAERAAHARELELRLREANQSAAFKQEKLESELSLATTQASERARAAEKAHAQELLYRTEELQQKLSRSEASARQLADQVASLTRKGEQELREASTAASETQASLARLKDEYASLRSSHEQVVRELEASRQKYSSMAATFEAALGEDEQKFGSALAAERARNQALKQRWSDDAARSARTMAALEERAKEAEALVADLQRHAKSQADNVLAAREKEEELQRKIQAERLEHVARDAQAARDKDSLRAQAERAVLEAREREKALDKLILERESDSKRFAHELELRLMQQRQAFQLEKFQADKELTAARNEASEARRAADASIAAAKAKHDEEKHAWMKEQSHLFDKKLLEAQAAAPSQALFDAQLAHAVDARVAEISKTFLSAEAHGQVLAAKLEAAKLEWTRERLGEKAAADETAAKALKDAEARHERAVEALRAKFEQEYSATIAQVQRGCRDYEEEIATERARRTAAEEEAARARQVAQESAAAQAALTRRIEEEVAQRSHLAEHLEQSGRVIERLQGVVSSERGQSEQRVAEQVRAANNRAAEQVAQAEQALKLAKERAIHEADNLRATHAKALADLEASANEKQLALRNTFESLLKSSSEDSSRTQESLAAELGQVRAAMDAVSTELHERKLAHAAQLHGMQMELEAQMASLSRDAAVERDQVQQRADQAIKEAQHALAHEQAQTKSVSAQLAVASSRLTKASSQLAGVRSMRRRLEASVTSLREQQASLASEARATLVTLYSSSTNAVAQLHSNMLAQAAQLASSETNVASLRQEVAQLALMLQQREEELAELDRRWSEEMETMKQEHLTELTLLRSSGGEAAASARAEVEVLSKRLADAAASHAEQMQVLREEHSRALADHNAHLEQLLSLKTTIESPNRGGASSPAMKRRAMESQREALQAASFALQAAASNATAAPLITPGITAPLTFSQRPAASTAAAFPSAVSFRPSAAPLQSPPVMGTNLSSSFGSAGGGGSFNLFVTNGAAGTAGSSAATSPRLSSISHSAAGSLAGAAAGLTFDESASRAASARSSVAHSRSMSEHEVEAQLARSQANTARLAAQLSSPSRSSSPAAAGAGLRASDLDTLPSRSSFSRRAEEDALSETPSTGAHRNEMASLLQRVQQATAAEVTAANANAQDSPAAATVAAASPRPDLRHSAFITRSTTVESTTRTTSTNRL